MDINIDSVFTSLTYSPFIIYIILLLISFLVISNKSTRQYFCKNYRLHVLPYSFLYLGMIGGFLGVLLSFLESGSEHLTVFETMEHQILFLKNAIIISITGLIAYFLLRSYLKQNRKLKSLY